MQAESSSDISRTAFTIAHKVSGVIPGIRQCRGPGLVAAVVFAGALTAFVPWIGTQEIWSKDEARTALVVREMLATGDWSLPRLPGGDYGRKPPLYHWLTVLIARRGLDETTLRLPAAVAAAGTAALTYLFGAQLATPAVGLVAAAVLVASPSFFEWARVGRMETLLVFCITLSLWGLGRWLLVGGRGNGLLFGLGIGLAVLAKGPSGLLPVAVAAVALVAYPARPRRLAELGAGLALAVALPLAWLAPTALAAPDFTRYAQSLGSTMATDLARPSTSALSTAAALGMGFLPWALLLPGSLALLMRRWPGSSPLAVVCLGWAAIVLVVFLVAISPRAVYFLPAYPALALLCAWGWHVADGRERRWLTVPLGVGVAAAVAAGIAVAVRPVLLRIHGDPLRVSQPIALAIGGVILVAAVAAFQLERRRRSAAAMAILAVGAVATLLWLEVGMRTPFYNQVYPIRATATRLEARVPPGAEVGYTESNRVTALAAQIARPLRQLSPSAIASPPPAPAPQYVLLPDAEFQAARELWSLERVDDVVFHNVRYVLAAVGAGAARPPR
jgi:4-amino-4-deoxy-L-arabinose transferase-like glycosyltransferase